MNRIVFTAWMGPGEMTANREAALLSITRNTGCAHAHVTRETLADWTDPGFPFHPAFPYLSAVHQCDYLRCYLLHVHGGGYADIKRTHQRWRPHFERLQASAAFGLGYTEVGPHGVARVGGPLQEEMQANYQRLIGMCALIFRPRTDFTQAWFDRVNALLDQRLEQVRQNPARHPQDRFGAQFTDGSTSAYPFAWTEVGGDILHPLIYAHAGQILHADIAPSFENYR